MSIGGGDSSSTFEEINVTPLTDVFLVLLVIMILIAPIIDKSDLKIKPPDTRNAKKEEESKGITIDIDKDGNIAVNAKAVAKGATSEDLQTLLKDFQKKTGKEDVPVTVNADSESKQRDVVAVMTAAAAVGIKRMRVATMQESGY
ncbi:MAG: biopolymer transporter ExbD [Candidatus Obscuribacterales bacterium]|nr:biopolymer transporter ExbD [Candidatus Obscuribacterales bacterium]